MSTPSWWLDELAHAGPEHLDARAVDGYDRKQGTAPDAAAAADVEVLLAHGIGADDTIVDLGAGTGRFAVAAAPHVGSVLAVDVSPAMVQALHDRMAGHDNVEVVRAGLLSYEHRGPPVAAIHTRNALHQLPDLWKVVALDRMARMLRPGGILRLRDLVLDLTPAEVEPRVEQWLDDASTDPATGYTRDDLSEHLRSEFSTYSWLLAPMLERAGFDILEATGTAFYGAYTCRRR